MILTAEHERLMRHWMSKAGMDERETAETLQAAAGLCNDFQGSATRPFVALQICLLGLMMVGRSCDMRAQELRQFVGEYGGLFAEVAARYFETAPLIDGERPRTYADEHTDLRDAVRSAVQKAQKKAH